jgi:energy-coupling factor transport system permease protein
MWKLRDVVVMVILSVVCGVIFRIWDVVTPFITIAWVPGQGIINGIWWIAAALIPYIIRRPGAAIIAEVVAAIIEFALAGQYGIGGIYSGLFQGVGAEIAFMLFAWRKYNAPIMMLSGVLAGIGYTIQWYYMYGGNQYAASVILLYTLFTVISGAILGGLLPKWIGDALNRTGVVRNFEIGRASRRVEQ